jgi:hypothetical protein
MNGEMAEHATGGVVSVDLDAGTCRGLCCDGDKHMRLQQSTSGYDAEGEFLSSVYDVEDSQRTALQWIEQCTAPQRWRKHLANPVYGPHRSGAWDTWTNGVSIVLCPDGKTYRSPAPFRGKRSTKKTISTARQAMGKWCRVPDETIASDHVVAQPGVDCLQPIEASANFSCRDSATQSGATPRTPV